MKRHAKYFLTLLIAFAMCGDMAAGQATRPSDRIRAIVEARLSAAKGQLSLLSFKDNFSFRLAYRKLKNGQPHWTHIQAEAKDRKVRLLIFAEDKLPYTIIGPGMLANLGGGGENLREDPNGRPVLVIDDQLAESRSFNFNYDAKIPVGELGLSLEGLVRSVLKHANQLSYSEQKDQLAGRYQKDQSIEIDFDWRPQAACAVRSVTLLLKDRPILVLSDIPIHDPQTVPDARRFVAMWHAMGYPNGKINEPQNHIVLFEPQPGWMRSELGKKRVEATLAMVRQWPEHKDWMVDFTPKDRKGNATDPKVLASRKEAETMAIKKTIYQHPDRAEQLLSSPDQTTRGWVVIAIATPPPKEIDSQTALKLLSIAVKDKSTSVRTLALSRIVGELYLGALPSEKTLPLIHEGLKRNQGPVAIRSIAYALEKASGGTFNAGNYPRQKNGLPKEDESATAWWMVHKDSVRKQAIDWFAQYNNPE